MLKLFQQHWDKSNQNKITGYIRSDLLEADDYSYKPMSFFSPYKSFHDFRKQLKAPIQMPVMNIAVALFHSLNAVLFAVNAFVDLVTLDFKQFKNKSISFGFNLLHGIYSVAHAIIDTIAATLSLLTRTLATGGKLVKDAGTGIASCFSSGEEETFEMGFK
ncbi:hypothetical protein Lade_0884 [Legionella adelaidensis]|uniref:Uncharacterized protein n=1 Tax=Legionella adelaidensis TaxID=45056 RepID=A0A0W0R5C4_9GAMM|nr:hypothetical protein [Legionella adelaidensis]KTC66226.1 hypothetical protein Lade_0884 [Legionella adelaidensis]